MTVNWGQVDNALTALGNYAEPEGMRHFDGRPDDDLVGLLPRQVGDESLVDLQFIDRQAAQLRQRRITSAVIIDREANSSLLQAAQYFNRGLRIIDYDTLGHFEANRIGREAIAATAVCLRRAPTWQCYLLDHTKPPCADVRDPEKSRIFDDEMARINIEASAALAQWRGCSN